MPMKMGWRWYGEGNDPISLSDITDDFFHLLRIHSAIMGKKKRQNRKGKALRRLSSSGRYAFPLYLLHRKLFLELSLFQLFTYDFLHFCQPID